MEILLQTLSLFLLAVSLSTQTKPQKYVVVKVEHGDEFVNKLNGLSDQGYRLLVGGRFAVLRLDATPPDTYRYLPIEGKGGPIQLTNWLNEQGARGYRRLPRTDLMEKAPHPRNYEYRYSPHGALGPSMGRELSSLVEEGYRPVDRVSFSHAIGSATEEMYFEHEVGKPAVATRIPPGTEIKVADAMRAGSVMKHVDEFSHQGYRFLSSHHSNKGGGIAVMMQKCSEDCAGRYEYRYFDAKDAAQIEKELNAHGKDGYQVAPASLHSRPHLLERDSRQKRTFSYRVLVAKDAPGLEQALNAPEQEGFVPLDYVWHIGFTAAAEFLVLEKETTASAAP